MQNIQFLGENDLKIEQAGNKAARLHELTRALADGKTRVPPGFVIPHSGMVLDVSFKSALQDAITHIGGFPVAVRSSSRFEDLEGASYAGQYESYLEVASIEDALEKIKLCFDSAHSARVRAYEASRSTETDGSEALSVLVQKMVPAKNAGVLFTIHPTTGREDHFLIECVQGLGERLVSGHATPTSYVYDWANDDIVEHTYTRDGGKLEPHDLATLARLALEIEAHYGRPQDIEWAQDQNGEIRILQARPITRIFWRKDVDEFTNADFKDGGVSARVCTPIMYSLYRRSIQSSMQTYFRKIRLLPKNSEQKTWIDFFYGRPYWNASEVKRRLSKVPGFDEKAFDEDLGIQKDYSPNGPTRIPENLKTILPVIPTALALSREYDRQLELTQNYREPFLKTEASLRIRLREPLHSFDDEFRLMNEIIEFQAQTEFDYFTTIYNNSNFQSDFKKLLGSIESQIGKKPNLGKLVSGLSDISHLKSQEGLLTLVHALGTADYQKFRDQFLKESGFHADEELNLLCPRWEEVGEQIDQRVVELSKSVSSLRDPKVTAQVQHESYQIERRSIVELLNKTTFHRYVTRPRFEKALDRSRLYMRQREVMREYSTRAYALVRFALIRLSEVLVSSRIIRDAGDIFFLYAEELQNRIWENETSPEFERRLYLRKIRYQGLRNLVPPNELGGKVRQRSNVTRAEGGQSIRGLGCSPGKIRARARVVMSLEEAYTLNSDEILVTQFTDPGWTPIFGKIAGVITEVGGMLSHAAVIGREFGIPAILNLPGARELLKTGQMIEMDGETGEITILS